MSRNDGRAILTVAGVALGSLFVLGALMTGKKKRPQLKLEDSIKIGTLESSVQSAFSNLVREAYTFNPDAKVGEAKRSIEYQNQLYAQGRTKPGNIVTYAKGCMSWHVQGRAIDILGLTEEQYEELGAWWVNKGGKWGGNFPGFRDIGHFEYHPGMRIEDVCHDS